MTDRNKTKFVNKIVLELVKYEPERKKRLLQINKKYFINIFLPTLILIILTLISGPNMFIFGMIPWLWFTIFQGIKADVMRNSLANEYKQYLKEKCYNDILQAYNLESIKGEGFSRDLLKRSNLFSINDFCETNIDHDDVIKGNYNNVEYTITETSIYGSSKGELIFNGVIISFNSNKKIAADTVIESKEGPARIHFLYICCILTLLFGAFMGIKTGIQNGDTSGILMSISIPIILTAIVIFNILSFEKMQKVKLEDTNFEKRFKVKTKDQVEARYLITPAFMERLKSLETAFGTKGIKCSFFDDQIMIAIPTEDDLFEIGSLYKPLGNTKYIEKYYDEITSIQQMINHFKLNEKTGL